MKQQNTKVIIAVVVFIAAGVVIAMNAGLFGGKEEAAALPEGGTEVSVGVAGGSGDGTTTTGAGAEVPDELKDGTKLGRPTF